MLKRGDEVICYTDDIEGYRKFSIEKIDGQRCTLKGIDTETRLCRVLDNSINHKSFQYYKVNEKGDCGNVDK